MTTLLERLYNAERICLFGAGASLTGCYGQLISQLGRTPDFLCDNAKEKWGKTILGMACISPADLLPYAETTAVVITVRRYEAIASQLKQMGFRHLFIACFERTYDAISQIMPFVPSSLDTQKRSQAIDMKGKWTLVTGASRGIGRQIAIAMAQLGSNLILHGRRLQNLEATAKCLAGMRCEVKSIAAELENEREVKSMLSRLASFPPIDIVFNNAAISLPCGDDYLNIPAEQFVKHFAVNSIAPIMISYALIPGMISRGFGRIVNISSTVQYRPLDMPYCCSKAALNKFVHDLAPELRGSGVMISLVCPGFVQTDMGGAAAPLPVESVIPGALLGAVMDADVDGRWFIAQDYSGMDLDAAMGKARYYYSL